ncbi:MAG: CoB--CoM heterodisulfide reductase iron-sulfur subunit B family protein [Defluviitaleaceae bacterium]|nr:CoB--CoM heterodisulfide reductase iron-sulfur subunit B family protein [Defluviitaleaceae bacterium]
MTYSYYPGCTLKTKAKDLDHFARASAAVLGFTLEEIDEWQCCGAVYPLGTDEVVSKLPAIRVLHQAGQKNQAMVTLCSACHHVFKRVNDDMRRDVDLRRTVRNYDKELDYDGTTEVLHYMEVLQRHVGFGVLKAKVQNPLTGRKIGAYYGCMLLRPGGVMDFDDPENPTIFEDFITALGGTPVPYPYRNECCGGYISLKEAEKAGQMAGKVLESAANRGATELITACPLCLYNVSKKAAGDVPIYYFTRLLVEALDAGIDF